MERVILHALSALLILPLLTPGIINTAYAQTGFGLDQSLYDFEIPAGTSHTDKILIVNNSETTPLPVSIDLLLWNIKEDADDIEFIRAEEGLNATQWFELDTTDFILEPGSYREVQFTVSPPESAPPGSYFVMMRFRPALPDFYFEEEGPRFIPEAGALFFIKVPLLSPDGDASTYDAEIASLEATGADHIGIIENLLPRAEANVFDNAVRTLIAQIKNTGIFHFKASGSVEVRNIFGRTVAEADIPGKYLLPNRIRPVETAVLPPPETDNLSFINSFIKNAGYSIRTNTYFGPYEAIVTLSVPDGTPIVKSVNFWVIPWQFWLIVSAVAIAAFFILRKGRGRFTTALKILIGRNKPTI